MAQTLLMMGDVPAAAEHAEEGVRLAGKDDWATVAATGMALGLVREAQGRLEEAEKLLREALDVMERVDFNPWEEEIAMAEFLLRNGRTAEGNDWLAKARASVARYGPDAPLNEWVERRGAEAAEMAGSSHSG